MSTGDFNVLKSVKYLDTPINLLFWAFWTLIILICTIIFLNFVITKACVTYDKIAERLTEYMQRDKANMVAEADSMKF